MRTDAQGAACALSPAAEKSNVFGYDFEKRKAVVMYPENCMVDCDNCTVACLWGAITHPDVSEVKEIAKTIPADRIKRELDSKLKANPWLLA
jgi:NAD-dependent dihydropyrimidine dehydrogenase PreA subunit